MSDAAPPRVAFYGNICNNLYQIAKALRKFGNIEAHLFVDVRSDAQQLPESDDPELAGHYPDWIHVDRYFTPLSLLIPWRTKLSRELSRFDLVVVSGNGPIYAQFSRRPVAFLTAGADVTMLPFPIRFFDSYPTWKLKLYALYGGILQRRGIRKSAEVWTQPFHPFLDALAAIGVPRERISSEYFPVVIDTQRVRCQSDARASGSGRSARSSAAIPISSSSTPPGCSSHVRLRPSSPDGSRATTF